MMTSMKIAFEGQLDRSVIQPPYNSQKSFQFGFFALALYIAFTRISDYKHHPTDIIAGIIVGIVFALIILVFLVDLFQRPRSFEEKIDEYDILGIQVKPEACTHFCFVTFLSLIRGQCYKTFCHNSFKIAIEMVRYFEFTADY